MVKGSSLIRPHTVTGDGEGLLLTFWGLVIAAIGMIVQIAAVVLGG